MCYMVALGDFGIFPPNVNNSAFRKESKPKMARNAETRNWSKPKSTTKSNFHVANSPVKTLFYYFQLKSYGCNVLY